MKLNVWRSTRLMSLALATVFLLTSCGQPEETTADGDHEMAAADELDIGLRLARGAIGETFGNGFKDLTPVVCRVGDIEITEQDMQLRYLELPQTLRNKFTGETGQKLLIRYMADEALLYQSAEAEKLYMHKLVAQQLVSTRRQTMIDAYRQFMIFDNVAPTEQEVRSHYEKNKDDYVMAGTMRVRHIECLTEEDARVAYEALHGTGREADFVYVCARHTKNFKTAEKGGDLGWINKGGFVAYVNDSHVFSDTVWDWEIGLHEPTKIGDRWHVIEIIGRKAPRQKALSEVREQVIQELKPSLQSGALDEHLAELHQTADIEYFGNLAPGAGRSPEELVKAGIMSNDIDSKLDIFDLVIEDFPGTDYAAQALFMKANTYIDKWGDTRRAGSFLRKLVDEYPDSELRGQAQYMLENLNSTDFSTPQSIEELRDLEK